MAELRDVRVLVVSNEQVGARMAGPAIRASNLAAQLRDRGADVTLAMPATPVGDVEAGLLDGVQIETFGTPNTRRFRQLARRHDVVVTQPQRVDIALGLRRAGRPVVYDLYVPSYVERIAHLASEPISTGLRQRLLRRDQLEYAAAIRLGDAFICASERQKDHWLGALGQAGRLDAQLIARDAGGDQLVGVVPFGLPDTSVPTVAPGTGAIRGRIVPEDSIIALWTGGLWNWFDPATLVEGIARARKHEPRLRLVVMGMRHPSDAWEEQAAATALRERAAALGLLDGPDPGVVLSEAWAPYAERHLWLGDADIGVSAHRPGLETRLSFRTRLLDHLWTGLPTISTEGGELTDRLVEVGGARTVAPGDAEGWCEALVALARDESLRGEMAAATRTLAPQFHWSKTVEPLVAIVEGVTRAPSMLARQRYPLAQSLRYVALLVRVRAETKGIRSLGEAAQRATVGRR